MQQPDPSLCSPTQPIVASIGHRTLATTPLTTIMHDRSAYACLYKTACASATPAPMCSSGFSVGSKLQTHLQTTIMRPDPKVSGLRFWTFGSNSRRHSRTPVVFAPQGPDLFHGRPSAYWMEHVLCARPAGVDCEVRSQAATQPPSRNGQQSLHKMLGASQRLQQTRGTYQPDHTLSCGEGVVVHYVQALVQPPQSPAGILMLVTSRRHRS